MAASFMRREIEEIPSAVRRLLDDGGGQFEAVGNRLRERRPRLIVTIARGSSDHAAAFLKSAWELVAGIPVASIAPSVASIYERELDLDGAAAVAISQSGKSPDIVGMTRTARRNGAFAVALTNTVDSPLAGEAEVTIDLLAGREQSVAATKSFVNSVVAGLVLIAHQTQSERLFTALRDLPGALETAIGCDWLPFAEAIGERASLYVLGRGPSLAVAAEAALKFKETCGLHAEAYSAAEVLHGPARIAEAGFPVLALTADDAAGESSVVEVVDRLAGQGARAFVTSSLAGSGVPLPHASTGEPLTASLCLVASFYGLVETLSRARGFDPDRPPHLEKVTQTR